VRKLSIGQCLRDDSDDASSLVQARVGQDAHETDIAAAIDELDAAPAEQPPDRLRSLLIVLARA
jgi:hypothetical protein